MRLFYGLFTLGGVKSFWCGLTLDFEAAGVASWCDAKASPHESQLVEGVLGHSVLDTLPARLIGDKAYDIDPLDRDLAERYGIEMISGSTMSRTAAAWSWCVSVAYKSGSGNYEAAYSYLNATMGSTLVARRAGR
jgi:hypothetical protein